MLSEENPGDRNIELSGLSLLHPSGTMGQGVYVRGDVANQLNWVTKGTPNSPQLRPGRWV
jgi:hypothetical protein